MLVSPSQDLWAAANQFAHPNMGMAPSFHHPHFYPSPPSPASSDSGDSDMSRDDDVQPAVRRGRGGRTGTGPRRRISFCETVLVLETHCKLDYDRSSMPMSELTQEDIHEVLDMRREFRRQTAAITRLVHEREAALARLQLAQALRRTNTASTPTFPADAPRLHSRSSSSNLRAGTFSLSPAAAQKLAMLDAHTNSHPHTPLSPLPTIAPHPHRPVGRASAPHPPVLTRQWNVAAPAWEPMTPPASPEHESADMDHDACAGPAWDGPQAHMYVPVGVRVATEGMWGPGAAGVWGGMH